MRQIAPTGESYSPATGSVPIVKWSCLEWDMNDEPDQIHGSVDGASPATFDDIMFNGQSSGWSAALATLASVTLLGTPPNAFDVYYDDIALDTKPIGCLH